LLQTWKEFEYSVGVCRVTNGTHLELLQMNVMSFHAVLKLFHICVYNHFEKSPIYYYSNNLYKRRNIRYEFFVEINLDADPSAIVI
jgi:hypothetical protein